MIVELENIVKGMVVEKDVINADGSLLISKGFVISNESMVKNWLKNNNITSIEASIPSEENKTLTHEEEYKQMQQAEIDSFVRDFDSIVNRFKEDVISNHGGLDQKHFMLLIKESLIAYNKKTINVFQLLQKISKEDVTYTHCNFVSLVSYNLGKWMNFSAEDLINVAVAGLLADVGKSRVPDGVLNKQGKLTPEEINMVKSHVSYSVDLLEEYGFNRKIIEGVKYSHEFCDGTGYPYGIKGDEIPEISKVICLADIFVALTSDRPYREKLTPFEAVRVLQLNYMTKLDIVILTEFIKKIANLYIGNPVVLSNGIKGEIIFINFVEPLRPIIKADDGKTIVDLSAKENKDVQIISFL